MARPLFLPSLDGFIFKKNTTQREREREQKNTIQPDGLGPPVATRGSFWWVLSNTL